MILQETYTLSNGVKIPKIALGTWMITEDAAVQAVKEAINMGYRHIDSAQDYGNEAEVGAGVRESGVSREEIFVTTKLAAQYKLRNKYLILASFPKKVPLDVLRGQSVNNSKDNDQDQSFSQLHQLESEHRDLDDVIERLSEDKPFDQLKLQRLKKRKLALRDEITKLRSLILPDIIA